MYQGHQQIIFSQQFISVYYEALAEVMMQYADANYTNSENTLSPAEKIEMYKNLL